MRYYRTARAAELVRAADARPQATQATAYRGGHHHSLPVAWLSSGSFHHSRSSNRQQLIGWLMVLPVQHQ